MDYLVDDPDSDVFSDFYGGYRVGRRGRFFSVLALVAACSFLSFCAGSMVFYEAGKYSQKIDCELPIDRYTLKEILSHRKDDIRFLGLNFTDGDWTVIDGKAVDVYQGNCLITLHNLYKAHNRTDQKLRLQIKSML